MTGSGSRALFAVTCTKRNGGQDMQPLWQIEGQFLLWIQHTIRQDWLTPIMRIITMFGDYGAFWIATCIVLLCVPKTRKKAGIPASCSLALNGILTNLWLKRMVARVRPYVRFQELTVLTTIPKNTSFPSGHTAASFAVAAAIYMAGYRKSGRFLYLLATLIGLSRLYLGVHYPTDVIAGAIVGLFSAWIIRKIIDTVIKIQKRKKRKKK